MLLAVNQLAGPVVTLPGQVESWAAITVAIVLQALPFLVLGIIVSSVISALLPAQTLGRILPRNPLTAVPVTAGAGMLLPGCECGSVPVAQSLMRRGVTPAAALAFLLASPAINPVVLVSTAVAFQGNPRMVLARFLASILAAIAVGWLWLSLGRGRLDASATSPDPHAVNSGRWEAFRATAMHDLLHTGGYLVLGAMLAAAIKVLVPAGWFEYLGNNPWLAVLLMAALAVVMSLCSEADAFIAASFTAISPTAQLVFLVVGPMVDIKLIAMQFGAWGRRFVALFAPLTAVVAVVMGTGVGLLLFGGL
ncbi:permease [Corynebacterium uterequi]|nr:permease [Corynebacterium uterequi]